MSKKIQVKSQSSRIWWVLSDKMFAVLCADILPTFKVIGYNGILHSSKSPVKLHFKVLCSLPIWWKATISQPNPEHCSKSYVTIKFCHCNLVCVFCLSLANQLSNRLIKLKRIDRGSKINHKRFNMCEENCLISWLS